MALFYKLLLAFVTIMQPTGAYSQEFEISSPSQSLFNSYVPSEISIQLSHMIVRGAVCQRSLVSRVYCLQACLRECADLGNQLTLYKMRCLSGMRSSQYSQIGNQLACKCYFTQRRRIHKARGRKCSTSAYSWYNVQDFFLKNYMNRSDCVPSSKITDVNSACGRIVVSMSNVTNIYNTLVLAIMQTSLRPQTPVTATLTKVVTTTTVATTTAAKITPVTTTAAAITPTSATEATRVTSTAATTTTTVATTTAATEEPIVTQQPEG